MGSVAKMGIQLYLLQLQKHPLRTKALTAGVISALNDIVAQKLSGIKKLQLRRLLLKVVFGWVYVGPCGHYLYMVLEKIFKGKMDNRTIAKKVLLEQVTTSPLNNLVFMMYCGLVIEGRAWAEVKSTIKKAFPAVQYSAWTFWPVVGWINHQFMPLQFRVIFEIVVGFFWAIFMNLTAKSMTITKG